MVDCQAAAHAINEQVVFQDHVSAGAQPRSQQLGGFGTEEPHAILPAFAASNV
jgi:hypothetical protein